VYRIRLSQDGKGHWIGRIAGLAFGFGPTRDAAIEDTKQQARRVIAEITGTEPTEPSVKLFSVEGDSGPLGLVAAGGAPLDPDDVDR
jgi:hypothetical protein